MSGDYSLHLVWFYNMQVGKISFLKAYSELVPMLKYSYLILANECVSCLGRAQAPDPVTNGCSQLLPWAQTQWPWTGSTGTQSGTGARLRSASGSCWGAARAGWRWLGEQKDCCSLTALQHDSWPWCLPVLASPPLRGINRVFPDIRGVLH